MVRQVILGLMFSIGLHTASAQGTCETNFKADGDAKTGLHFATSVPLPASDMKDVVEQLKQASKDETWQIGSTDFGEPVTKLTVNQKQTPHSRGFPLFFSLNKNTATLTFESTLPAGMLARADDTRIMMCRVLSKVKVNGETLTGETPAPTLSLAEKNSAIASKISPCPVTFSLGGTSVDGAYYTAWVPVPGMDAHTGIRRLKDITTKLGYDPGDEGYHGQEGTLAIVQKAEKNPAFSLGSNILAPYTIHFEVDDGLGTMAVQAHTPKDQNYDVNMMRFKLCSMIDLAAGYPIETAPYKQKVTFNNPFKNSFKDRMKSAQAKQKDESNTLLVYTDTLFRHAIAAGKSIVITPIINFSYSNPQALNTPEGKDESSSTVVWQDVHDPVKVFRVGVEESLLNTGMHGYQLDVTTGKEDYLVYIVDPGTYSVAGNTYDARKARVPDAGTGRPTRLSSLGQTNLIESRYASFDQKLVWHNATYADRTVHENYCTLEIVGGPCVASATSSYHVTDQTSAAGYQTDTVRNDLNGVSVSTKIEKEFASFTVAPGEVVVVDGFYADPSGTGNFQYSSCSRVGGQQVQCQLSGYSLLHLPSFLEEAKNAIHPNPETLPFMAEIFAKMQYRPLKITAQPGPPSIPGWGKTYKLGN
jgi:hypothetical protein